MEQAKSNERACVACVPNFFFHTRNLCTVSQDVHVYVDPDLEQERENKRERVCERERECVRERESV